MTRFDRGAFQTRAQLALHRIVLLLVVGAIYLPTTSFGFLRWDDDEYVTRNGLVQGGLNWNGLQTAFSTIQYCDYHPLTMLSLMLDRTAYGQWAGGFHLTNVLLHVANVFLLMSIAGKLLLSQRGGFFVALLFAIHPMHVESVAWISERKDLLSILFGLIAIQSYLRFTQQRRLGPYLTTLSCFVCSLLSKGTLVTLPCVLLLIDVWPLNRLGASHSRSGATSELSPAQAWLRPLLEKIPFFLVSLIYGLLLLQAQRVSMVAVPWELRLGNAMLSCGMYLRNLLFPIWLGPFYPHPHHQLSWSVVAISGLVMIVLTLGAFCSFRQKPALAIGWAWFLGTLVPMLGLVAQVGNQAMADRYAYFPAIGLYLASVWLLIRSWKPSSRLLSGTLITVALLGLFLLSVRQVSYWKSDRRLWTRALQLTPDNPMAHLNLGSQADREGDSRQAERHFEKAVELWPYHAASLHRLAIIRLERDQLAEAKQLINRALKSEPAELSRVVRGIIFRREGNYAAALEELKGIVSREPQLVSAHFELGLVYKEQGDVQSAINCFDRALQLAPKYRAARDQQAEAQRLLVQMP